MTDQRLIDAICEALTSLRPFSATTDLPERLAQRLSSKVIWRDDAPSTNEDGFVSVAAAEAWKVKPPDDDAPSDVWWDSYKDAWQDGFETAERLRAGSGEQA